MKKLTALERSPLLMRASVNVMSLVATSVKKDVKD